MEEEPHDSHHSEPSTAAIAVEESLSSHQKGKKEGATSTCRHHQGRRVTLFHFAAKLDVLIITVAALFNLGAGILFPIFLGMFGDLFDSITGAATNEPNWYVVWLIKLGAIGFGLCTLGAASMEYTAERQTRALRIDFLQALMRQEMAWFDKTNPTTLGTLISENSAIIRSALGIKFAHLLMFIGLFLGGYGVGLYRGWRLALVLTASLPLIGLGGFLTMRAAVACGKKSLGAFSEACAAAEEYLGSIRCVATYGLENYVIQRFSVLVRQAYRLGIYGSMKLGLGMGWTFGIIFLTYALGFWYGGKIVADDIDQYGAECNTDRVTCFTGGQTMGVFFCVLLAAFSIGQALPSYNVYRQASSAMTTMFQYLTRQSLIDPGAEGGFVPPDRTMIGRIEFKNVAFAYPTRPDSYVLKDFNLTIEPGTSVALVGASGCGKSTLVQLLERFYDVDRGQILLDGRDLREYNITWVREQIALVGQEPRLFATTIFNNIAYGKTGTTSIEEVQTAAKLANAHDFICSFPNGYDTYVGEGGSQLSGGQKQRIAIARALIRNAAVLILDEATSALDNQNEKLVQDALDRVMKGGRIRIIVAHRLTTVRHADKIVVLESKGSGGRVAEEGTHETLMPLPNGLYASLVALQTTSSVEAEPVDDILEIMSDLQDDFVEREASLLMLRAKFRSGDALKASADLAGTTSALNMPETPRRTCRFKDVLGLIWPYKIQIALGFTGAVVNGLSYPVFSICLSKFIVSFYEPSTAQMRDTASFWSLTFIAVAGASFLGNLLQQSAFGWAGEKMVEQLRLKTFAAMIYQDMTFFDNPAHTVGHLSSILSSDISACRGWVGDNLGIYCQNLVSVAASLVVAFMAHVKLAAVCLAGFVIMVMGTFLEAIFISRAHDPGDILKITTSNGESQGQHTASHTMNEVLMNLKTVVAFTMESRVNADYQKQVRRQFSRGCRSALLVGLAWGIGQGLEYFTQALYLWYGAREVSLGNLSPDIMMRVILSILMAAMGMGQSMIFLTDNSEASIASARIFALLSREPLINASSSRGRPLSKIQKSIDFRSVSFTYPGRHEVPIYRDLNFSINKGEVVALVGASGSGKSTIAQLLERLYDPSRGQIYIDDIPLQNYNVRTLRLHLGLVSQEPCLFDLTVEENIGLGHFMQNAPPDKIVEAAKIAGAHEFISALPSGYQTQVGRVGSQLSGGQKQRVAIARAVIRDPDLLILDEATSALDSEIEAAIVQALHSPSNRSRERTTIIIAHRLSTIRHADKIIVLVNRDKKGAKIAEVGTHDDLMKVTNGVYRGLVKLSQT